MFVAVIDTGGIKNALYRCDVCNREYTVFGVIGGKPVWAEPYNDEYCQECFHKAPGAVPNFARINADGTYYTGED